MEKTLEEQELIKLSGKVKQIVFRNEDNGYTVLRLNLDGSRDQITVVGNIISISEGEFIQCHGQWVENKQYGTQFQAQQLLMVPPDTEQGIIKYLSSGLVKGIGSHFAKQLVAAFGTDVFEVIENQPNRLLELEGIGKKRKEQIIKAWGQHRAVHDIMVFLHNHGVGTARAVRIYKTYGDQAIKKITENPYRLSREIRGIGFKIADQIAQHLGIDPRSPLRARAALHHVLMENSQQGHCAMQVEQLVSNTSHLLHVDEELLHIALHQELAQDELVMDNIDHLPVIYTIDMLNAELRCAEHIHRLLKGRPIWAIANLEEQILEQQHKQGLHLSNTQLEAIKTCLNAKFSIITGGPGVGKTTIINTIIQIVKSRSADILLCAPTGRAAKRLSESTSMEAKTIHRLLDFEPNSRHFKYHEQNPLEADLIVVDEASMIDISLMGALLRAIHSNCAVIIVGDIDQLPSVGPGSVLQDMINSKLVPTVRLTDIFRQAAESNIIVSAHSINQGKVPKYRHHDKSDFFLIKAESPQEIHDKMLTVLTQRIPSAFQLDPINDIQILTPMNKGQLGTKNLNEELQKHFSNNQAYVERFGLKLAIGDKVIQTVNNYDKEVFNGDIGTVKSIDDEEDFIYVDMDGRYIKYDFNELDDLSLAYAITIHKSQGSEYPAVIIPLSTQHYNMLQRNLIYTAVTRGKQLVVMIGQPKALSLAISNNHSNYRLTNLQHRIVELENDKVIS